MRYKSRTDFIIDKISKVRTKELILDIGFIGEHKRPFIHEAIIEKFQDSKIIGIDINAAVKNYKNDFHKEYHQLSIFDIEEKKDFKKKFDIVVLCEVFEHLPHPFLALHKIDYCLKKGGQLLMTYPNPLNLKIFLRYLFSKNITSDTFLKKYLGAPDHIVFPLPPSLIAYLKFLQFYEIEVEFLKGPFQNIDIFKKFSPYIAVSAIKK